MRMKKIKSKSILIGALLGSLILTGCQGLSHPSISDSSVDTTPSNSNESQTFESANGVTTILKKGEATPREGLPFSVTSLNEEFVLKSTGLYSKGWL